VCVVVRVAGDQLVDEQLCYLSFFKLALMVSIVCALFFAGVCMAFALSVVEYCSDEEHED
jgi:hypothetical protein